MKNRLKKKQSASSTRTKQEREYILGKNTEFFISEAYNTLRSNITFSLTNKGCKTVEVTSATPGEGKSINALNIAISYGLIGKKVLLIDCDLRKPKIHQLLGIAPTPGLTDILVGESSLAAAVRTLESMNLDVICAGAIPPNSTQLLEAESLAEFFNEVKGRYDYIILDTPPVSAVIDACLLVKYTNGIVFVIRQDYAKKENIVKAVNQLKFADGKIIGFLLNGMENQPWIGSGKYRYHSHKYSEYGHYYQDGYSGATPKEKTASKSDKEWADRNQW